MFERNLLLLYNNDTYDNLYAVGQTMVHLPTFLSKFKIFRIYMWAVKANAFADLTSSERMCHMQAARVRLLIINSIPIPISYKYDITL